MILTLIIDDAKYADFKAGILEISPTPPDSTDEDWIASMVMRMLQDTYANGKARLAVKATTPVIEATIIESGTLKPTEAVTEPPPP